MKAQTKTRWNWKDLVGNVGMVLVLLGLLILWDPLRQIQNHLVPALQQQTRLGSDLPPQMATRLVGVVILALAVVSLMWVRPAWLQNRWRRVGRFCLEAWAELNKVQWPTWSEVWTFTVVVLVAIIAVAIYIGFWDWIFTRVLRFLYV